MKAVTYFIYIVLWEFFLFGGVTYLVLEKNYSAWRYALAVFLSTAAYSPEQWIHGIARKVDE